MGRRGFLAALGSGTVGLWSSRQVAFWRGGTFAPVAHAQEAIPPVVQGMEGKEGLTILSDRPLNAETPVTLLDDDVTPNRRHFIRNNGLPPERARSGDASGWSLTVDGEVETPLRLTLDEIQTRYPHRQASLVLECAGNGRAGFNPPAAGNQWTLGAVGCARYTGCRLRDVLEDAGLLPSAVFVAYYGEDVPLGGSSGDADDVPISRGVGLEKALDDHTMLVWEMNGEPLPAQHGFPLRLIAPGWPGSVSGKWLRRLWVRDRVHDGPKMTGQSYRVPEHPVAPGTEVPDEEMKIIEAMPVKSIITSPATGLEIPAGEPLALRGHAWCGDGPVEAMHVSFDFAATWVAASLSAPPNPFAWQRWQVTLELPGPGYYEIWARATDHRGRQQSMVVPGWNPRGYLNNAMQRIAVRVV